MSRIAARLLFGFSLIVSLAVDVAGQSAGRTPALTFRELADVVTSGERLVVTTGEQGRVRGRLATLDASRLVVRAGDDVREFREADVVEVRRRGDRLWNGALIGAGVGGLGGALIGRSRPGCDEATFCGGLGFLIGMPLGAIVGLTVDAAMPHDHVLFRRGVQGRRWMVTPLVSAQGQIVLVSRVF
jgi:hypothetical protein